MATFTKTGLAILGLERLRKASAGIFVGRGSASDANVFIESGRGIGGDIIPADAGRGVLGLQGQGSDVSTRIETGSGIRDNSGGGSIQTSGIPIVAGAVNTGTALFPGPSAFPNTNVYPGQGIQPIARVRISYEDVSVATPIWSELGYSKVRRITISQGKDDEFSEFDAGQCDIALDNRDRAFDPRINLSVHPYNRIWVYTEFNSKVRTRFKGYVETWALSYPGGWADAEAIAHCADEFKVLAVMALPTTDPPRESYADLVVADNPSGQWSFNEDPSTRQRAPEPEPVSAARQGLIEVSEQTHPDKSVLNRYRKKRRF